MIRVLIAEEELLSRMGLLAAVDWRSLGMTVSDCVGDGLEALACARRERPDVMIVDPLLPGMDGIELLEALQMEEIRPVTLLISAFSPPPVEEQARLGIAACLFRRTLNRQGLLSALTKARMLACAAETPLREMPFSALCEELLSGGNPPQRPAAYLLGGVRLGAPLSGEGGRMICRMLQEAFAGDAPAACAARDNRLLMTFERPLCLPREEGECALRAIRACAARRLALEADFVVLSRAPGNASAADCMRLLLGEIGREQVVWLGEDALRPALAGAEIAAFSQECRAGLWAVCEPERIYAAWRALNLLDQARGTQEQERVLAALAAALQARASTLAGCRAALLECLNRANARREVSDTVVFLLENLHREVKLTEAADRVGFHEAYFSALFKRQMGASFSRFSAALRMEQAMYLLRAESLSPARVAERCGYHDLSYFYRVFRQHTGVTPSTWREQAEDAAHLF